MNPVGSVRNRHLQLKRVFALSVFILFLSLTPDSLFAQTESIEFRVEKNLQSRIADKIDEISRHSEEPANVESHGEAKANWICARAALTRTGAAIKFQDISAGLTATGFAAAKAGKAVLESFGLGKVPGLAADVLLAYAESDTLEDFTRKLAEIAAKKGLGKLLEKTDKLTDVDRKLIEKVAERIWNAFGGPRKSPNHADSWYDPACRDKTSTDYWIATEGTPEVSSPEQENLTQKNCEKRCADLRERWLQARSNAIRSERAAGAREDDLRQANRDLESAQLNLDAARKRLAAANEKVKFWQDAAAKAKADAATIGGQSYKDSLLAQSQARDDIGKWQSEVNRLSQEVAGLSKSTPDARALANKDTTAAKVAEDAYRRCLKQCYDEASKSGNLRDKQEVQKLPDPLTMPEDELLLGYRPPTTPESEPPAKKTRKMTLHFDAHGNCNCRFPESAPDNERLGKFDVVGVGELIPEAPVLEGKTIVINYKLGDVKFDVVASCGCRTALKSETAVPKTETQTAVATRPTEAQAANYYLPSGMEKLSQATAAAFFTSPAAPEGSACSYLDCCYECCLPNYITPLSQNAASQPPVAIRLSLAMNKVGTGKAIHIMYDRGRYVAQAYLQWQASGGTGLRVDLEVQRPGSATFERLSAARGPGDGFLFETKIPGTYLFRATATDSSGRSNFNTLSVTFPFIEETELNPK